MFRTLRSFPATITAQMTLLHASVDALCACTVFMLVPRLEHTLAMVLFILYNALAFVTQPFVGLWLDRRTSHPFQLFTATGLLIAGGILACGLQAFPAAEGAVLPIVSLLAVTLVGFGNSLFHVFGGIAVTQATHNDMRHLGIFVSSGALGLLLGGSCAGVITLVLLMVAMAGLSIHHYLTTQGGRELPAPAALPSAACNPNGASWLVAFIVLIVACRSFIGRIVPADDGSIPLYGVWLTTLAFCGKSAGGFLGRKWGVWPMLTVTLLLTGIFFLMGYYHTAWILAMTLTINLTMPLTLHLANRSLPHRPGFAFGLLASVLAPGVGLAMLCMDTGVSRLLYPLVATLLIEALVLLALGERRWQLHATAVVLNMVTNLALNALVLYGLSDYPSLPVILMLEGAVILIEALGYRLVLHRWSQALRYSLVCNASSYLLGLAFTIL